MVAARSLIIPAHRPLVAAARASILAFALTSLPGALLLDFDGENGSAASGKYVSITNGGTLGGTFSDITANSPTVNPVTLGRRAPEFTEATRMFSSLSASAWSFLHNGSAYTLSMPLRLNSISGTATLLLSTMVGNAADVGFHLKILSSGSIGLEIGNGAARTDIYSAPGVMTAGTYPMLQVTSNGSGLYSLLKDGVVIASGTRTSPSAAAPGSPLCLGYMNNTAFGPRATIGRITIHSAMHSSAELRSVRGYLAASTASRWNRPGTIVGLFGDAGLTDSSGASAWIDQSTSLNSVAQSTSGNRPAIVPNWRNGRTALQGAASKQLLRATLTGGDRAQPTTIYTVEETPAAAIVSQQHVLDGMLNTHRNAVYYTPAGLPSGFAGSVFSCAAALPTSTPIIRRTVINGANSSILIEPHGGATVAVTGLQSGAHALRGLSLFSTETNALNFLGKGAAFILRAGVPSDDPDGDAEVRAFLRGYYTIFATS